MVKLTLLVQHRTDKDKADTTLPSHLFTSNTDGTCTCSMAAKLPPNTIAVNIYVKRTVDACTGSMTYYPKSGTKGVIVANGTVNEGSMVLPITSQNIKYAQSVDAEVWKHCCLSFWIEGERKTR